MDNVLIGLPCGFDTKYESLKNGEKVIKCICEDEDLNVEDILNRPGNRLKIKEKEIEIELDNLKKMENDILTIKKDPHFYVEKSFERIFNELDIRKEIVRKEFEQKLNEYYTETRDDLVKKKEKMIQELEKSLAASDKYLGVDSINLNFTNCTNLKTKLQLIEVELEKIFKKKIDIKKILADSENVHDLRLSYENDQIEMRKIFGEIRHGLFDFKEKIILRDKSQNIWSIKQVDENKILNTSSSIIELRDKTKAKCIKKYIGHLNTVNCLSLLNNDQFASCSDDKTIKIWNLTNGNCLKTLNGHTEGVWSIKLLSNGQLASCSADRTIKLWNYESRECVKTINGHLDCVFCVEELQNNLIASGSGDKTIKIWSMKSCENTKTLIGHTNSIFCLKRIDSNKLASGSGDKTIKIWNLEKGECLTTLKGHLHNVYELALLKSGHLVSCSEDGTIRFWDIDLDECLETIEAHNYAITSLLLTKNEEVITGYLDNSIKVWTRV